MPSPPEPSQGSQTLGMALGVAAFGLWGLIPIYFKAVEAAPPLEVLAHRIVWSVPILLAIIVWRGETRTLVEAVTTWRIFRILLLTTILIAANWFIFIWAVVNGRILDASLGYFINPLVSVMLGVVFLRERLRIPAGIAVLVATLGVTIQVVDRGSIPFVSLILAFSFGFYGLLRKVAGVNAATGLLVEILLLTPAALCFAFLRRSEGLLAFGGDSLSLDFLLLGAGLVTVVPLVCFNAAARILPLSTLGFLQYIAPSGQFLLAVAAFGEKLTTTKSATFLIIWIALALFTWDRGRNHTARETPSATVEDKVRTEETRSIGVVTDHSKASTRRRSDDS